MLPVFLCPEVSELSELSELSDFSDNSDNSDYSDNSDNSDYSDFSAQKSKRRCAELRHIALTDVRIVLCYFTSTLAVTEPAFTT